MNNNIPGFKLTKDQILEVFHKMDKNSDLSIDKDEMYFFLTAVLNLNHQSSVYLKLVDKICDDMTTLKQIEKQRNFKRLMETDGGMF